MTDYHWTKKQWTCYNCSNHNYSKIINNHQQTNFSICSLCGLSQTQSIISRLKKGDQFTTMNNNYKEPSQTEPTDHTDDIDDLIATSIRDKSFDISCPTSNQIQCTSIYGLAKLLIKYKRWLSAVNKKTNGRDDIDTTIQVDIKNIDNATYQQMFMKTITSINDRRFTEDMRQSILQMVNDNIQNIVETSNDENNNNKRAFSEYLKKYGIVPQIGYI